MRILAIDTSCDESCASVIDTAQQKLCSNIVHSHVSVMEKYGGVVPEIASREHLRGIALATSEALNNARMEPSEIDWIAVTHRPGLIGALLVGLSFAKGLSFSLSKPLTALNHIEAHLFSPLLGLLEGEVVPKFPWISLVVSGGHTELFLVKSALDYVWLGGTLDDAAGEAFDKIGKLFGFSYPAGPKFDEFVKEHATESDFMSIRFPIANTPQGHFSFSGLKTAASLYVKEKPPNSLNEKVKILASVEEAIVNALVNQVSWAKHYFGVEDVVVTGGVACNSRLRKKLKAYFPSPKFCTDNAAMVASLASLYESLGRLKPSPLEVTAHSDVQFQPLIIQ